MKDADILRLLRAEVTRNGENIAATARKAGVSQAYVSLILSGDRTPGPKILKFLGVKRETSFTSIR